MVRGARSPSQEAFYTEDTGGNELESIFDANQIRLIQARINNIRGAALAQEEDNTDDGPGGQEVHWAQLKGQSAPVRFYRASFISSHFFLVLRQVTSHFILEPSLLTHTERFYKF